MDAGRLFLVGAGVFAFAVVLSCLYMVVKARKYGWNIVSYEMGKCRGTVVPRFVSLLHVIGVGSSSRARFGG